MSKLFSEVKNKNAKKVIYKEHPYGPQELKRKFYVTPVRDIRSLKINFPAPDITDQYKTAVRIRRIFHTVFYYSSDYKLRELILSQSIT